MSPNQTLLIYTDNMNVVDILSSLRCHPNFNVLIKQVVSTRVTAQVDVRILHIQVPGDKNGVADALSSAEFHRAKILAPHLSILDFTAP